MLTSPSARHTRQAAGLVSALPTARRPPLVLTSTSEMRTHAAIGQRACSAGAGVALAPPVAGTPCLALTSSSKVHMHAAIGQSASAAGRGASSADGRKAAPRAREHGVGAHARCHMAARKRGKLAGCKLC